MVRINMAGVLSWRAGRSSQAGGGFSLAPQSFSNLPTRCVAYNRHMTPGTAAFLMQTPDFFKIHSATAR
jgi:hypothetical protein